MSSELLPSIAVIADAHLHDIDSHYDFEGVTMGARRVTLRNWVDTRRASRVFNESKAALLQALHDISRRKIQHVVLLGDYTDDGQIEASQKLVQLLESHSEQFGTQFYAVTGNHDAFGPSGKHQSTRFVSAADQTRLVTSDPKIARREPGSAVLTKNMYCKAVAEELTAMARYGLFRQPQYLHWESPFGSTDALDTRLYTAYSADGRQSYQLSDASYLVEPVKDLWLLMIDANVFEPRNGQWNTTQKRAFKDSSDAGWNAVLRCRPHLLPWIRDVCDRADRQGKTLLCFSHYPVIDPFDDAHKSLQQLFGNNDMSRRRPDENTSTVLLQAGMQFHFSGHLHVNAMSRRVQGDKHLEDCSVPSLAAFPAAYKIVHPGKDNEPVDIVDLSPAPIDSQLMEFYRTEKACHVDCKYAAFTQSLEDCTLASSNYGEFLYKRMRLRVVHHYLENEWPEHIAQSVIDTTAADLAILMSSTATDAEFGGQDTITSEERQHTLTSLLMDSRISIDDLIGCRMIKLISDWYCLRHAGNLAKRHISPQSLSMYSWLAYEFGETTVKNIKQPRAFFAVFLGTMKTALARSESDVSRERIVSISVP